jgi:hypothetical protein
MTRRPRVYADFNDLLGSPRRLWLDTVGARQDLERQGLELQEGLRILLYDHDLDDEGERDDLVVEGIVSLDRATGRWCAFIDPGAIRHASECPETFFS